MSTHTLPLDLYKANAELQLCVTRLLQESGHEWLQTLQHASREGIAETNAEVEGLLQAANWQSLATLPSESFWRLFQQRTSDLQLASQVAIENQATFTNGLQQALEQWQKSVGSIMGSSDVAQPLQAIFKQWGAAWGTVTTTAQG